MSRSREDVLLVVCSPFLKEGNSTFIAVMRVILFHETNIGHSNNYGPYRPRSSVCFAHTTTQLIDSVFSVLVLVSRIAGSSCSSAISIHEMRPVFVGSNLREVNDVGRNGAQF